MSSVSKRKANTKKEKAKLRKLKQQVFEEEALQKRNKQIESLLTESSSTAGPSKESLNHSERLEEAKLQQNNSNTNHRKKGQHKQKEAKLQQNNSNTNHRKKGQHKQKGNNKQQGTSSNTSKIVLRSWYKDEPKIEISYSSPEPKSKEGASSDAQMSDSLAEMSLSESDSDSEATKKEARKSPVPKDRATIREDIKAFILRAEKARNPKLKTDTLPASVRPKVVKPSIPKGLQSEDINELMGKLKIDDKSKHSDASLKNSNKTRSNGVKRTLSGSKVSEEMPCEKGKINELEVTDCSEEELDIVLSVYDAAVSKVVCGEMDGKVQEEITPKIVRPSKALPVKVEDEQSDDDYYFVDDDSYFPMGSKDLSALFDQLACIQCHATNTIKVYTQQDSNCKFTKIMTVKCLNCKNILTKSPTTCTVVVSDGQKKKTVNKLALKFAENVVDSGLRYSEALDKLKHMNIPSLSPPEFETLFQDLHCWYQMRCDDMKALAADKVRQHYTDFGYKLDDGQMDIAVFFDGVEMVRRKYFLTAHWFVIEVETGILVDFEVLCRTCQECQRFWGIKKFKVTAKEAEEFMDEHKNSCVRYDTKSIVEWNREITSKLFARSVERGLRYSVIISNKNFSKLGLLGSEPYGKTNSLVIKSHLIHWRSQMYHDLLQALDVKRFGGDKEIIKSVSFIADIYMESIEKANKNYSDLRQWVMGSVFHHLSTDEKPLHRLCPEGPDSWCNYKKDIANDITPGKHWHSDKEKFDPILNSKWADKILLLLLKKLTNEELDLATEISPDSRKDLLQKINGVIYKSPFQLQSIIKYATSNAILELNIEKGLECKESSSTDVHF